MNPINNLEESCQFFLKSTKLNFCAAPSIAYNLYNGALWQLSGALEQAEEAGVPDQEIRQAINEVRTIFSLSPFVRRIQEWPRGYAGDYETIGWVINGHPRCDSGTLAYEIERGVLCTPMCQQHRNKVQAQAALIRDTIKANAQARVLVVACGASPDVEICSEAIMLTKAQFTFNDYDSSAIECSRKIVEPFIERCQFITGNILKKVEQLKAAGPFDLILMGGLLDYLNDDQVEFLIKNLKEKCLAEGGVIFFTNIAKKNPYGSWLKYIANWPMVERHASYFDSLVDSKPMIKRDFTGLTLLGQMR